MHEEIFFDGLDKFVRIKRVWTSNYKTMSIGLFVGKQQVSKLIYKWVTNEDLKGYIVVKELEIMVNSGENCKVKFRIVNFVTCLLEVQHTLRNM